MAGRGVVGVAAGAGTGAGEGSGDALRRGGYGRGLEDPTLAPRATPRPPPPALIEVTGPTPP